MDETQNQAQVDLTDEDMDSLVDQTENPAPDDERPMTTEPEAGKETPAPTAQEYEFEVKGQKIKAPIDKLLRWAQMGYDAPNRFGDLNRQVQDWQKKYDTVKAYEPYAQIDEFAAKNKDWWDHVQAQWKARAQNGAVPGQALPEVNQLKEELKEIKSFVSEVKEKEIAQKRAVEDQTLDQNIQSIRKTHANLDWNSVDEDGNTLERRVLLHADKSGIQNFRAAFRDLMHDDLVKLANQSGKEQISKDIQKRNKLGLLGTTPTPTKTGLSQSKNVKEQSYEELLQEGIAELSLNKGA